MKKESEDLKRIKSYLEELQEEVNKHMSESLELSFEITELVNSKQVPISQAVIAIGMAYGIATKQFFNEDIAIEGIKNILKYLDAIKED